MIINYETFEGKLEEYVFKNAKADLINSIATNPWRYIGLFRPTSPKFKLMQNITHSHEIKFGDFIEDIVTVYLGKYYKNLPKKAKYKDEDIIFDQVFTLDNSIYLIEQKIRDDHDSTKKRGQFNNFINKIKYLREIYPNKKIHALMWFIDPSLKKNKNYYTQNIVTIRKNLKVNAYLFYGEELLEFLDKSSVWDEMITYLERWKEMAANNIDLNFEMDWEETKEELSKGVTQKTWRKLISNEKIVKEILAVLFPTGKYRVLIEKE